MNLRELQGMKFPDEYIIKFFFKEKFYQQTGNVLELGCGNGNNLILFHQFGWNTIGIDIDQQSIGNALFNFRLTGIDEQYQFIQHDITEGIQSVVKEKLDVVLFPNVLCYLSYELCIMLMKDVKTLIRNKGWIFIRTRSIKDYRYGRGKKIGSNAFIIEEEETGEKGRTYFFYNEYEIVDMLKTCLDIDISTLRILQLDFQNIQKGYVISNSDIVVWGQLL